MREYLNTHEDKNECPLPIVSGAIGYFSYDYGREQMGVPTGEKDLVTIPEAVLTFYDCFIVEDCREKDLSCVQRNHRECPGADPVNGKKRFRKM